MKSDITGSYVKVLNKKQKQAARLQQAVSRTLESLEGRVLMAAGQLDWSMYDSHGLLSGTSGYLGELVANATSPVPGTAFDQSIVDTLNYERSILMPDIHVETQSLQQRVVKTFVDDGGKTYLTGVNTGRIGYMATWTLVGMPDPADPTRTIDVKRYFYGQITNDDIFVSRYNPDGSFDVATGSDYYTDHGGRIWDFGDLGGFRYSPEVPAIKLATARLNAVVGNVWGDLTSTLNDSAVTANIAPTRYNADRTFDTGEIDVIGINKGGYYLAQFSPIGNTMAAPLANILSVPISYGPTSIHRITDMRILPNGSFVLVGYQGDIKKAVDTQAMMFDSNGALLQTFSSMRAPSASQYSTDVITGVDVDGQGRLYFIGYSDDAAWSPLTGYSHTFLQRFAQDGTVDSAFGYQFNAVLDDFGGKNSEGMDVKIDNLGRIEVLAQLDNVSNDSTRSLDTTVVARFTTAGLLDQTFNGGGKLYIHPVGSTSWLGQELALQNDGGTVVSAIRDGSVLNLSRIYSNGHFDTTFGGRGFAQLPGLIQTGEQGLDPFGDGTTLADVSLVSLMPSITVNRGPSGVGDDKIVIGWNPAQGTGTTGTATGGVSGWIKGGQVTDSTATWAVDQWAGMSLQFNGSSKQWKIASNTATTVTLVDPLGFNPTGRTYWFVLATGKATGGTIGTAYADGTLVNEKAAWVTNQWAGAQVVIGTQVFTVRRNNATTLTLTTPLHFDPKGKSYGFVLSTGIAASGQAGTSETKGTIVDSNANWGVDQWAGKQVTISGKTFTVETNTNTTLSLTTSLGGIDPSGLAYSFAGTATGGTKGSQATPVTIKDSTADWRQNQWAGRTVVIDGVPFTVTSNTATSLTFAGQLGDDPTGKKYYFLGNVTVGTNGGTTLTDIGANWEPGQWVNRQVRINGTTFTIASNTSSTLTLTTPIAFDPTGLEYRLLGDVTGGVDGVPAVGGTIVDSNATWLSNEWAGKHVTVFGVTFDILSNDATTLTLAQPLVKSGQLVDPVGLAYALTENATGGTAGVSHTDGSLTDPTQTWVPNQWVGRKVLLTGQIAGVNTQAIATVVSNTATKLVLVLEVADPSGTGTVQQTLDFDPTGLSYYIFSPVAATAGTAGADLVVGTIQDSTANWLDNQFAGQQVTINKQRVNVVSNTATTLTLDDALLADPKDADYTITTQASIVTAGEEGTWPVEWTLVDDNASFADDIDGMFISINGGVFEIIGHTATTLTFSAPDGSSSPGPEPALTQPIEFDPTGMDYTIFDASYARHNLARVQGADQAPQANLQAGEVDAQGPTYQFVVTYSAYEMISQKSLFNDILTGNVNSLLQLLDPAGNVVDATIVASSPVAMTLPDGTDRDMDGVPDARQYSVTYTVTLAAGQWQSDGLYQVRLAGSMIADANTLSDGITPAPMYVPGRVLGGFLVNTGISDQAAPDVSFDYPVGTGTANDIATGMTIMGRSYWDFHVVYSDPSGVDLSAIGDRNILVTDSGALAYSQYATVIGVPQMLDGNRKVLVTYRILAPNATSATDSLHPWSPSDNGIYTISMVPAQVPDLASPLPNYVMGGPLGQFNVALRTTKTAYPVAVLSPVAPVVTSVSSLTFTVTFTSSDNVLNALMDAASIASNSNAILVTNVANGFSSLATYVPGSLTPSGIGNAKTFTATYQITTAGGIWDTSNNGVYSIQVVGNQVRDTDIVPNYIPAQQIGTFIVNVTPYVTAVVSAPVALSPTFNVTVQFLNGFVPTSLSQGDLTVTGLVNGQAVILQSAGAPVMQGTTSAIYTFYAPGGSAGLWDSSANGSYTVQLNAGKLTNGFVTLSQTTLGTFAFNYQVPLVLSSTIESITAATPNTWDLTVVYDDSTGLDLSSFDVNDISGKRTDNNKQLTLVCSGITVTPANNNTQATVVYHFQAPGNYWDWTDNGFYLFSVKAAQVFNTAGQPASAQDLWLLPVNIPQDLQPPTATVTLAQNVTSVMNSYTFQVNVMDNAAVDWATLNDGADFLLTSPSGRTFLAHLTAQPLGTASGPLVQPTYSTTIYDPSLPLSATNRPLTAADSGTWTISSIAGSIADVSGNPIAPALVGSFKVAVDVASPTASINDAPVVTSPIGKYYVVKVEFDDDVAVDVATLADGNVSVLGQDGISRAVEFLGADASNGAGKVIATYRVAATTASGVWDVTANGTYTLTLLPNQVADTSGNYAVGTTLGTFSVAFETVKPIGSLVGGNATITQGGKANYQFTVRFNDDTGISVASIGDADLQIVGLGGAVYPVTLVSVDVGSDGTPRNATYQFAAPGGKFSAAANGVYTIFLKGQQVADVSGNVADPANLGTLTVNVDGQAPTATVDADDVQDAIGKYYIFTVTYGDNNSGVDISTIASTNLRLIGPDGQSHAVELVSSVASDSDVVATYRVAAWTTSGVWDVTLNGAYHIMMQANQVADLTGNYMAAGEIGAPGFDVALETSKPTAYLVDDSPIVVTDFTATYVDFTVEYGDDTAVLFTSLKAGNILMAGPGGATYPVTLLSVNPGTDGSPIQATYRFTAPTGAFTSALNGTYSIVLQANQVADTVGNFADTSTLGEVQVALDTRLTNGVLTLTGTSSADKISVAVSGTNYLAKVNGTSQLFPIALVQKIVVLAKGGNDAVSIGSTVVAGAYLDGSDGNDTLLGGAGADTIIGGNGNDSLTGGNGNDYLTGGAGVDTIRGGAGTDTLIGGSGRDQMFGDSGNDALYAVDGVSDYVNGGTGTNVASVDTKLDAIYRIGRYLAKNAPVPTTPVKPAMSASASFSTTLLNTVSAKSLL